MKKIFLILLIAILTGCVAINSSTVNDKINQKVIEADESGFFFRGGTECLSSDASSFSRDEIFTSPHGKNNNDGSRQNPISLTKALCNVKAGQTIKVLPGIYRESIMMVRFGNRVKPIKIIGLEENGKKPILDGKRKLTFGMAFIESRNIIIENLTFQNFTDEGLMLAMSKSIQLIHNIFRKNGFESVEPDYNGEGFGLTVINSEKIIIKNNEAFENGPKKALRAKGILGTGIDTFALRDSVIRNNYSHNNIGGGILIEDGVNVRIQQNRITHNELWAENKKDSEDHWWDAGIWVDGGKKITLEDNIILYNHGPGIQVSDSELQYRSSLDKSRGFTVQNNIIKNNYWGLYFYNFGTCPELPPKDILIWENNTVSDNTFSGRFFEEYKTGQSGQILCILWPCGKQTACVSPSA